MKKAIKIFILTFALSLLHSCIVCRKPAQPIEAEQSAGKNTNSNIDPALER